MKVRILGCDGGVAPGCETTCFLVNENILIDGGSVASTLSTEEQKKIDYIFISHCHLDHIKDICFLVDNVFSDREKPIQIISTPKILKTLQRHIFNNEIWPDFSRLYNGKSYLIEFVKIKKAMKCADITVDHYDVSHPVPAIGFILEQDNASILLTGDTGPTELIWEAGSKRQNLKAIFTEIAFPDQQGGIARAAGHFSPGMFQEEYEKIPKNVPIYIYHFKPSFYKVLEEQTKALNIPKLEILKLQQELSF